MVEISVRNLPNFGWVLVEVCRDGIRVDSMVARNVNEKWKLINHFNRRYNGK